MDKTSLIVMSGVGLVGYVVFHGHRQGKDCFLCDYRGIAFLAGSLVLGIFLAWGDTKPKATYSDPLFFESEDSDTEE